MVVPRRTEAGKTSLCLRKSADKEVRRPNHQGDGSAEDHDSSNRVKCRRVMTRMLAHVRNQRRTKHAGEAPGRQHQSVYGAHILRTEVVGGKSGHGAKASSIAQQDNEGKNC